MIVASKARVWFGLWTVLFILICIAPTPADVKGVANYLPLHMAMEVISITISVLIFAIGWHRPPKDCATNTILLSCGFLAVALLDFTHMLSFDGMPDFVTPSSTEKAIDFWFAARLIAALTLLAVALLPWSHTISRLQSRVVLSGALLFVAVIHFIVLYYPSVLPNTYVVGEGLTKFKVIAEYMLVLVYALTAILFLKDGRLKALNSFMLFAAAALMAYSEYLFTLYGLATDFYNLTGHIYKLIGYLFLYNAVFVEAIRSPYHRLEESENHLQATLQAIPDLLFEIDEDGRYLRVYSSTPEKLVAPEEQLIGRKISEMLPVGALKVAEQAIAEARTQGSSRGLQYTLDLPGGARWFELSASRKPCLDDQAFTYVVIARDITERKFNEDQVRQLSSAVSENPFPIFITNRQNQIVYVNKAFESSTGFSAREVLGKNPRILSSGKTPESVFRQMWTQLSKGQPWRGELINRHKDGSEFIDRTLIYPLTDETGTITHYIAHKEDISEKKATADRLERLRHYDLLTGLANRALLTSYFEERSHQPGRSMILIWVDLDDFKQINDMYGHESGDEVIVAVAQRLLKIAPSQSMVSRSSGDDYLLLVPVEHEMDAQAVAQQIISTINEPLKIADHSLKINASLGIAFYPTDGKTLEQLIDHAEAAMYQVKKAGKNDYCFYDRILEAQNLEALSLLRDLKRAISEDELRLVYQPQVSLKTGALVGAEALLRWEHPTLGNIEPNRIIPLAEANGLMSSIDDLVMRQALAQISTWKSVSWAPVRISINLSANKFAEANLLRELSALFAKNHLDPSDIELELTEVAAMQRADQAALTMHQLAEMGVAIAIDDFGTGYSSLSYLKQFRVYKLKIDQSFVRDLIVSETDQQLMSTMIQMAHNMGLVVLVEGVETDVQLECLKAMGCDEIQGYLVSRPLEPQDFEVFCSKFKPWVPRSDKGGLEALDQSSTIFRGAN